MGFADLQMMCVDNRNPWADLIARVVVINGYIIRQITLEYWMLKT